MQFDHVGIATTDATEQAALYCDLLDARLVHEEEIDGLRVIMIECGDGSFIEFLEPINDKSTGPIERYLSSHGPGIHHIAYRTDDVVSALGDVRSLGLEVIDESPRPGAWGSSVGFIHPKGTGGVLIELVER